VNVLQLYKPSHFGEAFLSGIKVVQRMKTKTENKPGFFAKQKLEHTQIKLFQSENFVLKSWKLVNNNKL